MKRFFPKLVLFVLLFLVLEYFVGKYLTPVNIPPLVNEFKNVYKDPNILYFGDSTIKTTAPQDQDKRGISELLQERTPIRVVGLTHDGFDAQIFYKYAQVLSREPSQKKYVVIPINLRSFSGTWNYDFSDQAMYLTLMNSPFFPYITLIENLKLPIPGASYQFSGEPPSYGKFQKQYEALISKSNGASYDQGMRMRIAGYYLYTLTENNKQLKAFIAATKLLKNTNTHVIFYITPVDFQTGEKYFGKDFDTITRKNASIISKAITRNGGEVLDLSHTLGPNNFAWQGVGFINEHLNEKGRKFVATQVAKKIK